MIAFRPTPLHYFCPRFSRLSLSLERFCPLSVASLPTLAATRLPTLLTLSHTSYRFLLPPPRLPRAPLGSNPCINSFHLHEEEVNEEGRRTKRTDPRRPPHFERKTKKKRRKPRHPSRVLSVAVIGPPLVGVCACLCVLVLVSIRSPVFPQFVV